jgi:cytochrome c553
MRATFAVLGLLAGCDVLAEAQDHTLVEKIVAARERMHARYAATTNIENAIVFSDLPRAQAEARFVASLEEPDALPEWRPYIDAIRASADQVAASKDTMTAAKTMAVLGRRCAACHEAVPAKIVFPKVPAPTDDPKLVRQMLGHQWAAARLWEGVIGPSPERWTDGARALANSRFAIAAEGGPGSPGIADDVARMHLLANRALTAKTPDTRSELYGQLLATCARCHYTIRDR